jgi:hypothetical protein
MLTIRLPEDLEKRLDVLARETGRSKSFFALQVVLCISSSKKTSTKLRPNSPDPRSLGDALKGTQLGDLWLPRG